MEKRDLQNTILESAYNRQVWCEVMKEYFGAKLFHQKPNEVPLPSNDLAHNAVELGSFYTVDERLVGMYEVQLKDKAWIQGNRVSLRSLLRHVYKYDVDAALIVFVQGNKWRFSYVSEIREEQGKKETEPKRYTYLFGSGETCRTASDRFDKLKGKRIYLNDLFEAFNVEKLNKDFFKTYKEFYQKGVAEIISQKSFYKLLLDESQLKEEKQEKPIRDFVKKMLGRIVFLHFLQKKGWMGCSPDNADWKDGNKNFMLNLFYGFQKQESFYSECLTELFFNTLNNATRKNHLFKHTKTRVPYLNGGLFDDDQPETNELNFSVEFFKTLFEFFEQYNFTIDENDPYDSEVGIDPEMLGHIFENLLEENKDKGTFYTPKEIVQYICKASLIEYLKQSLVKQNIKLTPSDERAIENFIRLANKGEDSDKKNFVRLNAALIEKLLDDVKICDPAIGSGAFPMGILNEIYKAKMNLDWTLNPTQVKKTILQKSIYGVDIDNGAIDIARLRFWLALVVDEDEPQPLPNLDYKIMQGNSLKEEFEGIKLDRLLRGEEILFVNEDGQRDLFGKRKNPQLGVDFSDEKKVKLKKLLDEFYEPRPLVEKKALQGKIDKIILSHIEYNIKIEEASFEKQLSSAEELSEQITNGMAVTPAQIKKKEKSLELFNKQISELEKKLKILSDKRAKLKRLEMEHDNKPYFLWHVFFEDVLNEGGFDIIIGNPPYGAKLSGDEKVLFRQLYDDVHMRTPDSFNYFISKSLKVLKDNGVLSFIVPNNLLYQNENTKTRSLLINDYQLKNVINLGDNTFESADVPTCIFVALKKAKENYAIEYSDFRNEHIKNIPFYTPLTEIGKSEINQVPDLVLGMSSHSIRMMKTIEAQSWKIEEIVDEVAYGVSSGADKVFRISEKEAEKLHLEKELLHKAISGREIDKYRISESTDVIIYVSRDTKIDDYPKTNAYLSQFRKQLTDRSEARDGIIPWFALLRQRNPSLFLGEKIVLRQTDDRIRGAFDEKGLFTMDSVVNIKLKKDIGISYKFVLMAINSKLCHFLYRQLTQEEGRVFAQVKPQNVRKLCIPKISQKEQEVFEVLCDYVMFLNDDKNPPLSSLVPNTHIAKTFEDVVDGCLFECYFGEHMRERNINILESVTETIQPISSIKNKTVKAETINSVFQQLRKSENQIRNRMQLFVSSSPEYLKDIIQQ